MSNWWQSFQHISYFTRFGPPSPLNHLWSLSVEEQFYLLWPWLLVIGLYFVKERGRKGAFHPRLAVLIVLLALASAVEMGVLFIPVSTPRATTTAPTPARLGCYSARRSRAYGRVERWEARSAATPLVDRRDRGDRADRDRSDDLANRRVFGVHLPRRFVLVGVHGDGDRGNDASCF